MSAALSDLHRQVTTEILGSYPAPVVPFSLSDSNVTALDLSVHNPVVAKAHYSDTDQIQRLIRGLISDAGATVGIGGYDEKRAWYARGAQFAQGAEVRSIHLGVDIWTDAGTPVFAPYDSTIHSLQDNSLVGDYGPTIILSHTLRTATFYTLYGHLSTQSLEGKQPGDLIARGAHFAEFGAPPSNGDWPPHLHFQIIIDMLGKSGDYPGVAAESGREHFLTLCPDPNLILRSEVLG